MEWLSNLEPLLKVYWIIAIVASLVFIIQAIMTFVGMDSSDGLSADVDGDVDIEGPFQLFSLRNMVNFFLGFGWAGVCFYEKISSPFWLTTIALIVGIVFVVLFFFIMKQIMRLAKDNTFRMEEIVGKTADVYLMIPAGKQGKGKIQVSVRGAVHEIDAMTEGEKIPTGGKARIDRLIDEQTALVSKI